MINVSIAADVLIMVLLHQPIVICGHVHRKHKDGKGGNDIQFVLIRHFRNVNCAKSPVTNQQSRIESFMDDSPVTCASLCVTSVKSKSQKC